MICEICRRTPLGFISGAKRFLEGRGSCDFLQAHRIIADSISNSYYGSIISFLIANYPRDSSRLLSEPHGVIRRGVGISLGNGAKAIFAASTDGFSPAWRNRNGSRTFLIVPFRFQFIERLTLFFDLEVACHSGKCFSVNLKNQAAPRHRMELLTAIACAIDFQLFQRRQLFWVVGCDGGAVH